MDEELEQKVQEMEKELNELRPLKDTSEKAKQEFEEKEKAWLEEKKLLEEAANPNWPKARKTIDALKAIAKEKGIEVDDEGNVIGNPKGVDIEQVRQEAAQAARNELLGSRLEELLSDYDDESSKLVRHFYNKLTVGETVNLKNINKFIQQAHTAAEVESGTKISVTRRAANYSGGQGPRYPEDKKVLDDASAKNLANLMGIKISGDEQK